MGQITCFRMNVADCLNRLVHLWIMKKAEFCFVLFCFFVLFNTRFVSNLNYFRPRVSTTLGKTSFKFSAPRIWETVPPGLKCLPYHKFKKE